MTIIGNDDYLEILRESIKEGYVKAFKSLFEEEKKRREDAEAKLINAAHYAEILHQQLIETQQERDALRRKLEKTSPEIDNLN